MTNSSSSTNELVYNQIIQSFLVIEVQINRYMILQLKQLSKLKKPIDILPMLDIAEVSIALLLSSRKILISLFFFDMTETLNLYSMIE